MTQINETNSAREARTGKPTPEQIEAEIHQTKSAIAGEIKALGEKMSPEHLREGARHIIQDAKEEAQDVIREAKTAAADSMRTAKEHAMESVTETLDEVTARARRVTDEVSARAHRISSATTSFVSANAIPLTLLGVGAGWLVWSMRRERGRSDYAESSRRVPALNTYYSARQQGRIGDDDAAWHNESAAPDLLTRGKEAAGRVAERAKESGAHIIERAQEGAHQLSDRAVDLTHRAGEQLGRYQQRTTEFAYDNPLAVGALAVAAGVGIGLALPASRTEDRLMGATRDRLAREVSETAQQAARTAQHAARSAQGAMEEIKNSLAQPGTFR